MAECKLAIVTMMQMRAVGSDSGWWRLLAELAVARACAHSPGIGSVLLDRVAIGHSEVTLMRKCK